MWRECKEWIRFSSPQWIVYILNKSWVTSLRDKWWVCQFLCKTTFSVEDRSTLLWPHIFLSWGILFKKRISNLRQHNYFTNVNWTWVNLFLSWVFTLFSSWLLMLQVLFLGELIWHVKTEHNKAENYSHKTV